MLGAFSAALDGYQVAIASSIVSNKGFIRQMSSGGIALNPTQVAVWGGMLSTGQFIGVGLLQLGTDILGRKKAMHLTWLMLVISVALETAATNWLYWLFAKLIAGAGLGMMQATYPVYISEQAPTQIRGSLTTSYMFWYVLAQIFAPLALRQLAITDPYDFRTAILTQWGMLDVLLAINIFLPESPWWLAQKGMYDKAGRVLAQTHKGVTGYDVKKELSIMVATVKHEKRIAAEEKNQYKEISKGPKAMQQLAGQSVTNNYSTYFFQLAGNKNPFTVTVILAVCQLMGVLVSSLTSDKFSRQWLTLGLFRSGAVSILAIGIVGYFNYQRQDLGSLLACLSNFRRLQSRTASIALIGSFYLGFRATGIISCMVGYFILPEIRGQTPAEIDEMFKDKIAPHRFRKHVTRVQMFLEERGSKQVLTDEKA
ncbi:MFS general substrate transporter [Trichoderma asperelloides]|nr:MFS general substrate transporter [Trichoderma asperelloides]